MRWSKPFEAWVHLFWVGSGWTKEGRPQVGRLGIPVDIAMIMALNSVEK
jgi:hypothetical protein